MDHAGEPDFGETTSTMTSKKFLAETKAPIVITSQEPDYAD
jgi:hypothetical protein